MDVIREIENYGDDVLKLFSVPICDLAYPIARLALYDFKGSRYVIAKVPCEDGDEFDSFVLSYEDKGSINLASLINQKEFYQLDTLGKMYTYTPGDVSIYDKEEDKESRLYAYNRNVNGVDYKSFVSLQINYPRHKSSMAVYKVDQYPNPNIVLDYLEQRSPYFYQFTVGGRIICAKKQYILNEDNYYNQCVEVDGIMKPIFYRKCYSDEQLRMMVEKTGFESNVPRELVELYKEKNDKMNDIKSITKEYIKSI